QLVLDKAEELGGFRQRGRIVRCHRKYLAHSQVHPAFAGPDVADTFEQFVETVGNGGTGDGRILQAFVVQREALDQVLSQALCSPAAELGAARRAHPDRKSTRLNSS